MRRPGQSTPAWRERPGPWVQAWKERNAEAYIARVLAETLWSREAWILWKSVLVRLLAGRAGGPARRAGAGVGGSSARP